MTTKRKGLGRGLEALLGAAAEEATQQSAARQTTAAVTTLPLEELRRGRYQPRLDIREESLQELADSITAQGVIQPIVVRPLPVADPGGAHYEIIAGERRWRAAQLAGLADVPVIVRDVPDEAAVAMALIENIQREDLNPLEESHALHRLISEFELTHQEAADAVGRSRAAVSNLLRLRDLTPDVQSLVRSRELEMGHARALLAIEDPREQRELARRVVARGLSVRETERLVGARSKSGGTKKKSPASIDPDVRRLETELAERLGAPVAIRQGRAGRGQLVIDYHSLEELDGILAHIR